MSIVDEIDYVRYRAQTHVDKAAETATMLVDYVALRADFKVQQAAARVRAAIAAARSREVKAR
jgi:hypothetical protein